MEVLTDTKHTFLFWVINKSTILTVTKDLGYITYFLHLKVTPTTTSIFLSKQKYTTDLIEMAQILDAKKELNVKCNKNSAEPVSAPVLYQTLFGCLIYPTTTRSDIYYVVQVVNQIMSNPWHLHGSAVLLGIRYLQGTPRCGIFFARDSSVQFTTYANVDWVRCLDTCQSGTSWYIFLENSLIR